MAVSWSWAWGNEPLATLVNMEFDSPTAGGTQQQTSATVYTYAGSPTRYAWETSPVRTIKFPTKAFINAGTVALPIQAVGSWYAGSGNPLIMVYSGTSSKSIEVYCSNAGAGTISMYVDNVLAGTTTLSASNWHYLALQYDMTGTTWTATLYVDGTSAITGSDTGLAAAASGYYETGGFGNNALCGQLIVYDTGTAIAVAKTPIYVTRLSPQTDVSDVGSWTPAANPISHAVCAEISNNPLNTATNTTLSPAASADDMITQATGINGLINATGSTPLAVTAHTYSSGTSVQVKAAVEGGAGGYAVGSTITPDTADTTYAFATYDAGSGAISSTANINFKYEIV